MVYLGWAWLFWTMVVFSGKNVWSFPNSALFLVGGLSPLLAGLGLLGLTEGREGFRRLWVRMRAARRIRVAWWLVLVGFYPLLNLLTALILKLSGVSEAPLELMPIDHLSNPAAWVSLVAFSLLFPLPEEIGLRGYWLDRLQERWSALGASLILGVTWASWHIPLFLMEGYYSQATFDPELVPFLVNVVASSVLITWVYNNTGRSVLAAIVFHFMGNFTGEVMGIKSGLFLYSVGMSTLVALLVVAYWGGDTLVRAKETRTLIGQRR